LPILEASEVTVRFGGNVAVDNVSVAVEPGTITGLIGPNGAGKTTLFNVITGLQGPTSGSVVLDGRDITRQPPHKRARMGLARTFQRLELFTSLSVYDNIKVAGEIRNRWNRLHRISPPKEAERIIELVGLEAVAQRQVSEIPTGQARVVELARALMTHPKVLLLDEPASGQDEEETDAFGALLQKLRDDGTTIFLVEHDVGLVMRVCQRIFVLDFGQVIAEGTPAEIQSNQAVLDAYLGSEEVS
jgi:branched-chain amino acid transport system ATP-binding protein